MQIYTWYVQRCILLHFVHSMRSLVFTYLHIKGRMLMPGLYKMFHPAIPDRRTWSKLGEHGQDGEHDPCSQQI